MAQGGSFFSFGGVVRVDETTLYRWVENHEEFSQSKSLGELLALKFYEDLGKAQMTGSLRRVKREITKPDGTKEKEYSPTKGDGHVLGIVMRARFRKFGYSNNLEVTGKGGGPIRTQDVSNMTYEELQRELDLLEKQGV